MGFMAVVAVVECLTHRLDALNSITAQVLY